MVTEWPVSSSLAMSSNPGTHMVEEENQFLQCPVTASYAPVAATYAPWHVHTHLHPHDHYINVGQKNCLALFSTRVTSQGQRDCSVVMVS